MDSWLSLSPMQCFIVAAGILFLLEAYRRCTVHLDVLEPPLLRPLIPFVGHLIGYIRSGVRYNSTLYNAHRLPIATLPILGGKMYVIWGPELIDAAFKKRELSFTPIVVQAFHNLQRINEDTARRIRGARGDFRPIDKISSQLQRSMVVGDGYHWMKRRAFDRAVYALEGLGKTGRTSAMPELYTWVQDVMMDVVASGLYGDTNPLREDAELGKNLWTYSNASIWLFLNIFPSILARKSYQSREYLQNFFIRYFTDGKDSDPTVSRLARAGVEVLRENGISDIEVGKIGMALLPVATLDTVRMLYWCIVHIWTRRELAARIRAEVEAAVHKDSFHNVTIDVSNIDRTCPLLTSTFREVLRFTNYASIGRQVIKDTILTDKDGRSYLLKKGCMVQAATGNSQWLEDVWGPSVETFDPERFLHSYDWNGGEGAAKKLAFKPWGGGKHLCPGKDFAFAAICAILASLLVGYDLLLTPEDDEVCLKADWDSWSFLQTVAAPLNGGHGLGVRISRREGWEGARLNFS